MHHTQQSKTLASSSSQQRMLLLLLCWTAHLEHQQKTKLPCFFIKTIMSASALLFFFFTLYPQFWKKKKKFRCWNVPTCGTPQERRYGQGKLLSDRVKHKYWLFEHTGTILNWTELEVLHYYLYQTKSWHAPFPRPESATDRFGLGKPCPSQIFTLPTNTEQSNECQSTLY